MISKDVITGLIRHILTFGGGFVVAKGYLDAAALETVVGAVVTIFGVVWSAYDKKPNA